MNGLDGDRTVMLQVTRQVDGPHSALAKNLQELVLLDKRLVQGFVGVGHR
jgi:hypothetical protein